MKSDKASLYSKISSSCLLPGSASIPRFVRPTNPVRIQPLIKAIGLYGQTLEESIVRIENSIIRRDQTQSVLTKVADQLVQIHALLSPVDVNSLEVQINEDDRAQSYNDYFGIREAADMDVLEFAQVDACITYAVLLELLEVSMDEFELINYLQAVLLRWTVIKELLSEHNTGQNIPGTDEERINQATGHTSGVDDLIATSFHRWRIGHYAFALDALYANLFLTRAVNELDAANETQAAIAIQKAGIALRATTVSMVLASKMPKTIYNDHVRPSMGLGFSGADNLWWNQLVKTKQIIIEKAKALHSPGLKQALLEFQEKYLQDIEMHTWIASKLVGNRPSLTLEEINSYGDEAERNERFATADLRSLHYLRQYEFEFLNYYPILHHLFNQKN